MTKVFQKLAVCFALFCLVTLHAQQRQGGQQRTGGGQRQAGGNAQRTGGAAAGLSGYAAPGEVGQAIVTSDPETRRLIVITDDETSQYISQVITNLDRPKPQVLIKVVFLEVTYRNASDIGIDGAYRHRGSDATGVLSQVFGNSGIGSAANATNSFGVPVQAFQPNPPGAGLYQILGQDFQVTLRAIATAGKTEVLSRPSILTRNNQMATISLGQEVPLVTNVRFDQNGNQINTVTYQNVGIILRVTPFITSDGLVEMIVQPEISGLAERSQWVPISGDALAPVINSRLADTVVVVPHAQTVIIGGLMQNAKNQNDSKIPFLGDIPGLGNLFKRRGKSDEKTELIIFLTPHIVNDPTQLAGLTTDEQNKALIAPKAFTQEELDRYLDTLPNRMESQAPSSKLKRKQTRQ